MGNMGWWRKKRSKIYHLQKGQDAQVKWSSFGAAFCIHPPDLQSSVGDALQMGRTEKAK